MKVGSTTLGVAAALFALLGATTASAQTSGAVTLAPGFLPDPQRLGGISGGPVQANTLSTQCRGWIAPQANHLINVTSGFQFLRVFIESSTDTTLVIRAPNGQYFCNDDAFGFNPDVDAAYGAGQYLVWVGSYSQANAGPYTVTFTQQRTTIPANSAGGTPMPSSAVPGFIPGRGAPVTVNTNMGGSIYDYHTTPSTVVVGQACRVANAELNVRGRHTFYSDLTVRLRSPSGDVEVLQSHQQRSPFRHYSTTHFNNQNGAGGWTLSIEDSVGQDGGALNGFSLTLTCI